VENEGKGKKKIDRFDQIELPRFAHENEEKQGENSEVNIE
jgi:hypothetical protein